MILKRLVRIAAVAAAVAVAGTALTAQPAAAATSISFRNSQAQFDNNPGNGAEAWVWVWTGSSNGAKVNWAFYDGNGGSLTTGPGPGLSASLPKDVWQIQLCEWKNGWGYLCSEWKS